MDPYLPIQRPIQFGKDHSSLLLLFVHMQLLFIIGVAMTIGAQSTVRFFLRPKNYKGTGFFMGGIILVVWGWTLIGFALEAYGFWQLFSGFFPTALSFLRRMPFLRQILDAPAFKSVRDAWSVSAFLCLLMSQHMKYKFHSPKMVQVINRIAPPGGLPV